MLQSCTEPAIRFRFPRTSQAQIMCVCTSVLLLRVEHTSFHATRHSRKRSKHEPQTLSVLENHVCEPPDLSLVLLGMFVQYVLQLNSHQWLACNQRL
ncbi:hypothetical protein BDW69DRAFT_73417 [Aspergillus filifer]